MSDSGKGVTASGHASLPSGQGNTFADDASGSGQPTATAHVESGHGVTGIGPRIETESFHAASGSGQKTATALGASGHEQRVTRTMTVVDALDLLTANGKRSESKSNGDVHASYSLMT